MTMLGLSSKREVTRTSIRVRTAMAIQTREQGRYLGGRPPYGYRLGDAGPHPNKAHATWGRRAHRLEPDPASGMAQKIQTLFIDDIDGGAAEGTVRFALDGTDYEIDLSSEHSDELHTALRKYVEHARKVGGTARRPGARDGRRPSTVDTVAVRAWARENGHDIKDRGRVPADLVAKYQAATGA
jgi:hypothetical protein